METNDFPSSVNITSDTENIISSEAVNYETDNEDDTLSRMVGVSDSILAFVLRDNFGKKKNTRRSWASGSAPTYTGTLTGSVDENAATGTTVTLDYTFSDPESDNLSFTISGSDASVFSIPTSSSQDMVTAATLDCETKSTYTFTLTVNDDTDHSHSITITVNDVNEYAPSCSPSAYFANRDENLGSGVIVATLLCTDQDDTDSISNYTIASGDTLGQFTIDSGSNDVKTSPTALDYETTKWYTLLIDVVDSLTTQKTGTATVYVTVNPLNEYTPSWDAFSPAYINANTAYDIAENVAIGTTVVTMAASDADDGADGQITFSLESATDSGSNSALDKFRVDPVSGEIETTGTFDIDGGITYFDLVVKAADQGTSSLSVTRQLKVGLTDINDNSPVFSQNVYDVTVAEGAAVDTSVLQLSATDADVTSTNFTYVITAGDSLSKFRFDATNPDTIEIAAVIDLDTGTSDPDSYTLTLQVSDGTNTGVATVYVRVTSSNDHTPAFGTPTVNTVTMATRASYYDVTSLCYVVTAQLTLRFLTTVTTTLYYWYLRTVMSASLLEFVAATDDDYGVDGDVTYSITGGDTGSNFDVDSTSGVISLKSPADYETLTPNPVLLEITATDSAATPKSATVTATVTVTDVNDNAPTCTDYAYTLSLDETDAVGTSLVSLTCTDADSGESLSYTLYSGNTNNDFTIDSSGQITTANALDYDAGTRDYSLVVHIKDNSDTHTSTVLISVNINPINEDTPTFSPVTSSVTYAETTAITTALITKSAADTDASPHDVTGYEIVSATGPADTFQVDSTTGQITLAKSLDYANTPYEIVIKATDGGASTGTGTVSIVVTDDNNNWPTCPTAAYNLAVAENDLDSGAYGTITYTLTQSPGSGDFSVSSAGVVTMDTAQDFESGQVSYSLQVTAADDGGTGNSVIIPIQVSITAVNEGGPVFSGTFTTIIGEDAQLATSVIQVTATDVDGDTHEQGKRTYRIALEQAGTNSATVSVTVSIDDVDDNEPICTTNVFSVNVNEDVTIPYSVVSLQCTDADETSTLSYALASGDSSVFTVTNGDVVMVTAPDYDVGSRQYDLTITVSDNATTPHTVSVKGSVIILPVNEFSPTFTPSATYSKDFSEDTPVGTVLVTVLATDGDSADTADGQVTYSVVSGATSELILNGDTGVISLSGELDRETIAQYVMTIEASDGTNSATATVTINVTDVNDNTPIFNPATYSVTVPETTATSSTIVTVTATDDDDPSTTNNGVIVYTITAGNPGGEFSLDATTGVLTLASSLDYETTSSYVLEVTAKDKAGGTGSLSAVALVTVTVSGSDEGVPVFTSSSYAASLSEAVALGTSVVTVTANDVDGNDGVYYTLASDPYFYLDSVTGIVYVKAGLNYEVSVSHTLTVTAWDAAANSVNVSVIITVTDVNDNVPDCAPRSFKVTVREDVVVDTMLATLTCTDDDSGSAGNLNYAITSVNGNPGVGSFAVNGSGVLTISSGLDYESDVVHAIVVDVFDTSASPLTSTVIVVVTVTDVNEYAPTFTSQPSTLTVSEDTVTGTSVVTITATDGDTDDTVEYSFNPDDAYFMIDPGSGVISLQRPLDRETAATVTLTIRALDSGTIDAAKSASHVLTVTVSDVNDVVPTFSPASYFGTVSENDAVGKTIVTVTATDADAGTNGDVTYSIVYGNSDAVFRLDLVTPARTGEIILDNVGNLDYELTTHYDLVVEASDVGGLTSNVTVAIDVTPYNEWTPQFTPTSTYSVSLAEDTALGVVVVTVVATDADNDVDGEVVYAITSGGEKFDVDVDSGNVTLVSGLDRETSQYHTVVITATDRGQEPGQLTSTATLSLTVLDVNDNSPACTPTVYGVSLAESASVGDAVVTLTCSDADADAPNNVITFAVVTAAGSSNFDVDANTGVVTVASGASIDYETTTNYTLTLRVSDSGSPALTSDVIVTVQITGVNEVAPVFSPTSYSININEDMSPDYSVIQVTATDADSGDTDGTFYYTISGGNTGNKFIIDTRTGDIKVSNWLDRETVTSYALVIHAVDYGNPPLTGTTTVSVVINDVNDNPPICATSLYTGTVAENSAAATAVGVTISCTDADVGVNGQLEYSIVDGNAGGAFDVDVTSGVVSVLTSAAVDAETYDVMTLTVMAADKGVPSLNANVTVVVKVTDVNEFAPQFSPSVTYSTSVSEASTVGTSVVTVTASDADVDGHVTFSITAGDPGSQFRIDPVTGLVSLQDLLDYETSTTYTLEIEAVDEAASPLTSTATLTVTVTDYNDNVPSCPDTVFSGSVAEDSTTGTSILTVTCTDSDTVAINVQLEYRIISGDPLTQFAIDVNSGLLSVADVLDYENATVYQLVIEVNDLGTPSLTATAQASIAITGVNEYDPVIVVPGGGYAASVAEDAGISTSVITVNATDADLGVQGQIRYGIASGNAEGRFAIEEYTGVVYTVGVLDREMTASYTLTVEAIDSLPANGDQRSAQTAVIVTITDVNDNYPTFVPAVYGLSVLEGATIGSTIVTLTVTDDDDGTNALYDLAVVSGDSGGDFSLSGDDILVAGALDHELGPQYDIRIRVSDRGTPSLSSTAHVIINVLSQNEYTPVFDSTTTSVVLAEDTPVGTLIYDGNATDADSGAPGVLKYYLVSGDPSGSTFLIDPDSGKLVLGSYLDYDTSPQSYTLTLDVYDNSGSSPYLQDTLILTLTLTDVNDNTPTFTQNTYTLAISEDVGDGFVVTTVTANDADSGSNADVIYVIDSGDGIDQFTIDNVTGTIRTASPQTLDREVKDTYTLMIKGQDQGSPVRSSYCIVKVTLNDVNDNDPDFTPNDFTVSIDENLSPVTLVTSVYATDPDIGNNALLTFSIDTTSDPNGHFSITKVTDSTAKIYTTTLLDRENIGQYNLVILAVDMGTTVRTGTATVTVIVNDLNDNTPVISSQPYDTSIYENVAVGTTVHSIAATDADLDLNARLTYVITGGDGGQFKVDPDTGTLTTKSVLDRETTDYYKVVVEVRDSGSPTALTATTTATVTILDINDNAPIFAQTFSFTVSENVENGTFVGRVIATDADIGSNAAIQYTVIQTKVGHDGYFDIDLSSGDMYTVTSVLDREDVDSYVLTVRAADGGTPMMYVDGDVTITVADQNDNRPTCLPSSGHVTETDPSGSAVLTVVASDLDAGNNALLVYAIQNGTTAADYFAVDSASGDITLTQTPDREAFPTFTFVVEVTDSGVSALSTNCSVTVTVGDTNDNSPVFLKPFYNGEVAVDLAAGTFIIQLLAVDSDSAANAVVMYQFATDSEQFVIGTSSGNVTKKSDTSLEPDVTFTLQVVATDSGVPARSTVVTLRLDTFIPVLHVISINMSLTEQEALGLVGLLETRLSSTLRDTYPTAVVRVWKIEKWYKETATSSGRRRLLQTSEEQVTVHVYALASNDTSNENSMANEKTLLSSDELLAIWRADSGTGEPASSIKGDLFDVFRIISVSGYTTPEQRWVETKEALIVFICVGIIFVLIVIAIVLLVYYCYWKKRRRSV
ncbi:hypothetical protein LSH36_178g06015 [Paralvinella palmiformis]|uniref:Cadherin domain-containing protein n=1 Tax=Paralvinella palmiformis TaxID=53620 RepID=A0AAD9JSC2_9ANNE|nr:hypothetical protein LSH36_178g06015 [Paralvinella palmiformis]